MTSRLLNEKQLEEQLEKLRSELADLRNEKERLALREEKLRSMVEAAQDFIYLVSPDLTILYVNQTGANLFRLNPQEVVGKPLSELFSADIYHRQAKNIKLVLESGEPVYTENPYSVEGREFWLNARLVPVRSSDGKIIAVAGTSIDITVRKQAEDLLIKNRAQLEKQVEERTKALFEANQRMQEEIKERKKIEKLLTIQHDVALSLGSMTDMKGAMDALLNTILNMSSVDCAAVYWVDEKSGEVTLFAHKGFTQAFIEVTGHYTPDTPQAQLVAKGKPIYGRYSETLPMDPIRLQEGLRALVVLPVLFQGKAVAALNLGSHIHDDIDEDTRYLLEGLAAQIGPLVARVKSEAELKASQARLLHSQKLESLGILAGGIAHDFNNLLMGVLGNADVVLLDLETDSPLQEYIQDIYTASLRLSELTNQMLAYAGKGTFNKDDVDLSQVVREVMDLIKVSISKKVALHVDLAADLPTIKADQSQLKQIVMNLVTNASEACSEKGGQIHIQSKVEELDPQILGNILWEEDIKAGSFVSLEVTDTGGGMDEATKVKIFDPFFTTKFTGRGLGLASVMGIVRSHHGFIQVQSTLGHGTSIRVFFPSLDSKGKSKKAKENVERGAPQGLGTVLLVDDDHTARTVAKAFLEKIGFTVIEAENDHDVLKIFQTSSSSIVAAMLDGSMPCMDGSKSLVAEIRKIRPNLPIIEISGCNQNHIKEATGHIKPDAYLQKPFTMEALLSILNKYPRLFKRLG